MILERYRKVYPPKTVWPKWAVDKDTCIGSRCRFCFQTCPTGTIKWNSKEDRPYISGIGGFEKACLNCYNCVAVCPSNSITMTGEYRVLSGRYKTFKQSVLRQPMPFVNRNVAYKDIEKELTDVEKVIYKRRSNRIFKDTPVPEELLHRIMEAGRYAPTAGNNMPFTFIVVTDQSLLREIEISSMRILRLFKNLYLNPNFIKKIVVTIASYFMVNEMDQRPFFPLEKSEQRNDNLLYGARALIILLIDQRGISNPDLDAGICAQNMVLTAHALGLGTCYNGYIATAMKYMPGMRKRLGIKYPWKVATTIAIGYPKVKTDHAVAREDVPIIWFRGQRAHEVQG
jgi:nitroreductase/NAD-dependent dihydropyrimidine dehydrogenase PreA subunit